MHGEARRVWPWFVRLARLFPDGPAMQLARARTATHAIQRHVGSITRPQQSTRLRSSTRILYSRTAAVLASPLTPRHSLLDQVSLQSSMSKRRKSSKPNGQTNGEYDHDHDHDQDHNHSHDHGGIFHSHSHGDHGDHTAEAVVKLLQGQGLDKGTKVTVLGIFTNVGLTAVKGAAGWYVDAPKSLRWR